MEKLILTKKYKTYYSAKNYPEIVIIEPAQYLSITGKGNPSGEAFAERIEALYSTAYAIKFSFKLLNQDFAVPKLEALWWFNTEKYKGISMTESPKRIPREEWEYRLLIRMPEYVTPSAVNKGIEKTLSKKNLGVAHNLEPFKMAEGKCIQILHTGPFENEPETLQKIETFVQERGFQQNGLHHEIYLSDFNKTAPEKLKTILREPIK